MTRNSIARIALALAGSAAALAAAPVMAKPMAVEANVPATTRQASLDDRICVTGTYTGSRIPRTICRTRGEFIATWGVDPTVKN